MFNDRLIAALEAIPLEFARSQSELAAQLQQFKGTIPLEGARARAADSKILATGYGRLVGWSVTPVGATALLAYIRDGRDANGDVIAVIACQPGASSTHTICGDVGVSYTEGLFLDVVAGTVVGDPARSMIGSVHIGAVG